MWWSNLEMGKGNCEQCQWTMWKNSLFENMKSRWNPWASMTLTLNLYCMMDYCISECICNVINLKLGWCLGALMARMQFHYGVWMLYSWCKFRYRLHLDDLNCICSEFCIHWNSWGMDIESKVCSKFIEGISILKEVFNKQLIRVDIGSNLTQRNNNTWTSNEQWFSVPCEFKMTLTLSLYCIMYSAIGWFGRSWVVWHSAAIFAAKVAALEGKTRLQRFGRGGFILLGFMLELNRLCCKRGDHFFFFLINRGDQIWLLLPQWITVHFTVGMCFGPQVWLVQLSLS